VKNTIVENSGRGHRNILKSADVVKNGNSKALELSVIDDPADVNGLAGVADAGADGQCDVYWNRTKGTLAQSYHFT